MNIETKIESKVPSNWIQCVVGTQPTEIYFRNVRLVEVMYTTSTLDYKNLPHNPSPICSLHAKSQDDNESHL